MWAENHLLLLNPTFEKAQTYVTVVSSIASTGWIIIQCHSWGDSGPIRWHITLWRYQMAAFSALLAICAGNYPRTPVNSQHKFLQEHLTVAYKSFTVKQTQIRYQMVLSTGFLDYSRIWINWFCNRLCIDYWIIQSHWHGDRSTVWRYGIMISIIFIFAY